MVQERKSLQMDDGQRPITIAHLEQKDISMNKGPSLWKPQDAMDHFETLARHSDVKRCV